MYTIVYENGFQYLMKLHYSQTMELGELKVFKVSVPYEITLLSNCSLSLN